MNTFMRITLLSILLWGAIYVPLAISDIYVAKKVYGPVTNIVRIDANKKVSMLTKHKKWRELDLNVSSKGDIAFISNMRSDTKIDLYKKSDRYKPYIFLKKDGSIKPLVESQYQVISPRFSPDSKMIAYMERQSKGTSNEKNVTALKVIVVNTASDLLPYSENNVKTIFKSEMVFDFSWHGNNALVVAHRNGEISKLELISLTGHIDKKNKADSYSVALIQNNLNAEQELLRTRLLLQTSKYTIAFSSGSPDQKYIAYIKNPLDKGDRSLWLYDLKSDTHRQLSIKGTHVQNAISWSGTSTEILFSALKDYNYHYDELKHKKIYSGGMQLFLSGLNGRARQITYGDHRHQNPVFSPDDKSIAFLYADTMNARQLSLKTINKTGKNIQTLLSDVAIHSQVFWR